jgi:hypothetical protein
MSRSGNLLLLVDNLIRKKKPQISPLRCAPVEMTNLLHGDYQLSNGCTLVRGSTNLSSRPERTRISCRAAPDMAACAAFFKESRMKIASATNLNRKFRGSAVERSAVSFRFSHHRKPHLRHQCGTAEAVSFVQRIFLYRS